MVLITVYQRMMPARLLSETILRHIRILLHGGKREFWMM